jgi:hypothetical protein
VALVAISSRSFVPERSTLALSLSGSMRSASRGCAAVETGRMTSLAVTSGHGVLFRGRTTGGCGSHYPCPPVMRPFLFPERGMFVFMVRRCGRPSGRRWCGVACGGRRPWQRNRTARCRSWACSGRFPRDRAGASRERGSRSGRWPSVVSIGAAPWVNRRPRRSGTAVGFRRSRAGRPVGPAARPRRKGHRGGVRKHRVRGHSERPTR